MSTDCELLEAGARAAAKELFERYVHPLYRFFHNKVGEGVEDLMQDRLVVIEWPEGDWLVELRRISGS